MKIKLVNIRGGLYNAVYRGRAKAIVIEKVDIEEALTKNTPEYRSFQGDLVILLDEWNKEPDFESSALKQKKYHVDRIATIIKRGLENDPIFIYKGIDPRSEYLDGGHRILAAKHLELLEVEAVEVDTGGKVLTTEAKTLLWDITKQYQGNMKKALNILGYKFSE